MSRKWYCLFCMTAVGCRVGPNYHSPQAELPTEWSEPITPPPELTLTNTSPTTQPATQPSSPTTLPSDEPVDLAQWWQSLHDRQLDSLIQRASDNNLDLRIADYRISEALALRDVAVADYFPQVNLGGGYTHSRASQNSVKISKPNDGVGNTVLRSVLGQVRLLPGGLNTATGLFVPPSFVIGSPGVIGGSGGTTTTTPPGTASPVTLASLLPSGTSTGIRRDSNLYNLGFNATWELDVWGRIHRAVEAADADLLAIQEARRDTMVTLFANLANNYIQLRGEQRRLAIALDNIQAQAESLEVSQQRYQAGFTTQLDVAQAQTQLESTRSQVPVFEASIRQSIYQIAILLGQPPEDLVDELSPAAPIPSGSTLLPSGLPAELLRRRPDIRQAERQLAAATARIGVATAELFPKFSLNGSFGVQSAEMKHFLDTRSLFWSVGPGIQWPIFEGGRLKANIRAEEARTAQSLATYGNTVIVALQQVENALVAYEQERVRRETLTTAVSASQQAADLSNDLYRRGLAPFLNVLDAQRALYLAQDALVVSETSVMTDLVSLYQALGGGWEIPTTSTQEAG